MREALFAWMVSPDNPFFARAFVNRVWAHYFGVGIVDPADNFSVANPPSNEKLLDALAKDFIESKFDIRKLEKTILMSPMTEDRVDVERLLLLEEGHCLRDQALAVCGTSTGRRVANYGATSMATLLQVVSHGMGITLIPEIAVKDEASRNRMRIVPFADPQPSRRIGLVWRSSASGKRRDFEALGAAISETATDLLHN